MSNRERKIDDLLLRLRQENAGNRSYLPVSGQDRAASVASDASGVRGSPIMKRPQLLIITDNDVSKQIDNQTEEKLREIMAISGNITINNVMHKTSIKDMEVLEELGNGTCGHVVKMRHKPTGEVIAVKQMRRSGNSEESKRIIMDIEVVLKSHDCKYIVKCLGCFITEPEVWICMELMETCFDKLLKRLQHPIPENILGKVTVATVEALSYLKDKHGVIHRDVKPSNILLDKRGNIKLCDFGISGRLVDSMAKTRSAGCAAYMAPERIEPDPDNPEYDIRADVWSLGITLVELATGVFPYKGCSSDFEVLTKVIKDDPPSLPLDKEFSPEFRSFVNCCLTKEKKQRPKYVQLKNEPFLKKYLTADVDVGEWFMRAARQADAVVKMAEARHESPASTNSYRNSNLHQKFQDSNNTGNDVKMTNGGSSYSYMEYKPPDMPLKGNISAAPFQKQNSITHNNHHVSRFTKFHNPGFINQRDSEVLPVQNKVNELPEYQRVNSPYTPECSTPRNYSSIQSYPMHNYCNRTQQEFYKPLLPEIGASNKYYREGEQSVPPYSQQRIPLASNSCMGFTSLQRQAIPEARCRSTSSSPLLTRHHYYSDQSSCSHGNTSPILLQRFHHQQRQQQAREAEECDNFGNKRYATNIKMQLSADRNGWSSRNQSPDPPPRLNRSKSGEQSPSRLRRICLDSNTPLSPMLPRRYTTSTPPTPPPRQLLESTSVPGSPQHMRTYFHTPEPHRHIFRNNLS